MTFSLVARCDETGMFGVAISSSSPAVAARCSFARAGIGAVASQNVTDPSLGPLALGLMESGMSAQEAIEEVKRRGRFIEYRQVLAVDRNGNAAIHSGPNSLGIWTQASGKNVASGGNLLANDDVPLRCPVLSRAAMHRQPSVFTVQTLVSLMDTSSRFERPPSLTTRWPSQLTLAYDKIWRRSEQ